MFPLKDGILLSARLQSSHRLVGCIPTFLTSLLIRAQTGAQKENLRLTCVGVNQRLFHCVIDRSGWIESHAASHSESDFLDSL